MVDGLRNIRLKDSSSGGDFIKFKDGEPVKVRIFSTNPLIANDQFGNTKYNFSCWNFTEARAMVLSAGATITRAISDLHNDEDYGADVTKVDIKITPTGEKMERRYTIQVLPKPATLTPEDVAKAEELDANLEKLVKNGIRAEEYNNGGELPSVEGDNLTSGDVEYLSQVPPEFLEPDDKE